MKSNSAIHVAVGMVFNSEGKVLVALRPRHAEQGDLWEFPGGKVEEGETIEQALKRELFEEVGITIQTAKPLTTLTHQYPQKKVFLDVWLIDKFTGEAYAKELQSAIKWVSLDELSKLSIPAANHEIIQKLLKNRLI